MTFMSSLAANPSSGIYGQQPRQSDQDVLGIVNQMKDRENQDFEHRANFMADLSNKQERMRALFDPSGPTGGQNANPAMQGQQGGIPAQQGMNTVMAKDPNQMTGYEKGELGIRQKGLDLEHQKLTQQGKMGEEALGIKTAQEKLNQQKSDQINQNKINEGQRKADESAAKIDMLQQQLDARTKAGEDTLQVHKDLAAAVEERHNLERDMNQHKMDMQEERFNVLKKQHEDLMKQNAKTKQTKTDSSGNKIVTETEKGDAINAPKQNPDGTYTVTAPDGTTGKIPANKLDDWMQNHHPQPEEE